MRIVGVKIRAARHVEAQPARERDVSPGRGGVVIRVVRFERIEAGGGERLRIHSSRSTTHRDAPSTRGRPRRGFARRLLPGRAAARGTNAGRPRDSHRSNASPTVATWPLAMSALRDPGAADRDARVVDAWLQDGVRVERHAERREPRDDFAGAIEPARPLFGQEASRSADSGSTKYPSTCTSTPSRMAVISMPGTNSMPAASHASRAASLAATVS